MSKRMVERIKETYIENMCTLGELKSYVDSLVNEYGEDAEFSLYSTMGCVSECVQFYTEETDTEYQARIDRELRINANIGKKQERVKLAELKAKYES